MLKRLPSTGEELRYVDVASNAFINRARFAIYAREVVYLILD